MRIIAGNYRGKKLLSPTRAEVRPTADRARESVFNILNSKLDAPWEQQHLLDIFAGSGAFALEALSRGAASVCLVDIDISDAKKNAALFPKEAAKISLLKASATALPPAPPPPSAPSKAGSSAPPAPSRPSSTAPSSPAPTLPTAPAPSRNSSPTPGCPPKPPPSPSSTPSAGSRPWSATSCSRFSSMRPRPTP